MIVIGCFCIGTNQVDIQYAAKHGIAVFNSPFSNSRSVAELVIAEIIALARQLGDRSNELHHGTWKKVSNGCWEIRGKTLGIVYPQQQTFLYGSNASFRYNRVRAHWIPAFCTGRGNGDGCYVL